MGRDQVPGPGPGIETLNPGVQAADPGPDLFLGDAHPAGHRLLMGHRGEAVGGPGV